MTVVALVPDQWAMARDIRLQSLLDDPDAFGARYEHEVEHTAEQWRDFIARQTVLVVLDQERPVALTTVENLEGDFGATCWLGGCWVVPSERGRGHLRRIMDFIDTHAVERDWSVQGLGVWIDNYPAITAYEALGFVPMGDQMVSTRQPPRRYQRMIRQTPAR